MKRLDISRRTLFTLIAFAVTSALIYFSDPYPTRTLNLAVGQPGSSYDVLGRNLATYFKRYGLQINLIETTGMREGVAKLDDDQSAINAAFMTAGQPLPVAWSGLVSLGSVQYSPLWLIYRGNTPKNEMELFQKKIAIGVDGTNTQSLFKTIAQANGYSVSDQPNLFKIKHAEAVELFNAGEIDAIFIVDGIDSENIQKLLQNPKNQLYNFQYADAYAWQLPYVRKLTIPKGSFNLETHNPRSDINLLATSITLLVEENTHPYIQWLLLKAIRELHNDGTHHFSTLNFFPARLDSGVELSSIAERYYDSGFPELTKYMPFWIAIYFDRIWVVLLSFLAVILPIRELWSVINDLKK